MILFGVWYSILLKEQVNIKSYVPTVIEYLWYEYEPYLQMIHYVYVCVRAPIKMMHILMG